MPDLIRHPGLVFWTPGQARGDEFYHPMGGYNSRSFFIFQRVRNLTVGFRKMTGSYEQIPTFFASLRDLMAMKKAAGRPKDQEDLRALEEIEYQKRRPTKNTT